MPARAMMKPTANEGMTLLCGCPPPTISTVPGASQAEGAGALA